MDIYGQRPMMGLELHFRLPFLANPRVWHTTKLVPVGLIRQRKGSDPTLGLIIGGESNAKVQWTPLAEWHTVLSWSPIREGGPPNVHFYP